MEMRIPPLPVAKTKECDRSSSTRVWKAVFPFNWISTWLLMALSIFTCTAIRLENYLRHWTGAWPVLGPKMGRRGKPESQVVDAVSKD
jgi:hypothetical protein